MRASTPGRRVRGYSQIQRTNAREIRSGHPSVMSGRERPRYLSWSERLDEEPRVPDLAPPAAAHEPPQLFVRGPASPRGLLLQRAEGTEVSLRLGHLFDGGNAECPDQLRLQIRDADVEAESFHACAIEIGAESRALEAVPELALLARVAETGQLRSHAGETPKDTSDRLRTADRHDRDPFRGQVAPAAPGERFERDPVADTFDEHDGPMRLLFVCSGNTCRSAMAAAIARSRVAPEVEVESAGTGAVAGDRAMPEAIAVARRHGLALDDHRTKALTRELVESADHVLVMKPEHGQRVQELVASAPVTCLEIDDPIGRGEDAYEDAWRQLDDRIAAYLAGI